MTDGIPTIGELARQLERFREDVREDFVRLSIRLDNLPYVSKELYEANRQSMKRDIRQVADVAREADERANKAWAGMRWAIGLIATAITGLIVTLILALVTGGV